MLPLLQCGICVGSVGGADSARLVLRALGSSKSNRVMRKLQEEGTGLCIELVSEPKQTAVVAEMGDNYLRLRQRSGPFALLGKKETDRHKELLDAAAELLFILPSRGKGKQPSRLNYVLKNVFLCLEKNNVRKLASKNSKSIYVTMT